MSDRLTEILHEFTRTILSPFDLADLLDRLILHTMELLDAEGAGIMLVDRDGELGFAAASGDRVAQMERVQEHSETGVCYHAFTINEVVIASDIDELSTWPRYTERARELGFEAVIGVPLNARGQTIGVLNVYREQAGKWTEREVELCEILAAVGAGYILNANEIRAQHELAEQLQGALDTRTIIEQAKGLLMATEGDSAANAFKRLRELSMNANRKLRDVAQELVDKHEKR
jgi:signal transduction protein with GAF and PtsI domain